MIVSRALVHIVNGVFLIAGILLIVRLLNVASKYNWNYGDTDIQVPLRLRMFRLLLVLIVLGLVAALFNLVAAFGSVS